MSDPLPHAFSALAPDRVLNVLDGVGLHTDGRLLAFNSYENYQLCCEDDAVVLAKFYRPDRWSAAEILEEHAFLGELAETERQVVRPWQGCDGETLHEYDGFRFAVFPRQGGHALEVDRADVLERMGRRVCRGRAGPALQEYRRHVLRRRASARCGRSARLRLSSWWR